MFGWIMPEPFAHPPIVTFLPPSSICTAADFGTRSVVRMARANCSPPSRPVSMLGMPERISAMGSSTPMTPVVPMIISPGSSPAWAAASATVSFASTMPCAPTPVFAIPLLTTSPRTRPASTFCLVSVTDGDTNLFWVYTPTVTHARSETRMPRSHLSLAYVLIPA